MYGTDLIAGWRGRQRAQRFPYSLTILQKYGKYDNRSSESTRIRAPLSDDAILSRPSGAP